MPSPVLLPKGEDFSQSESLVRRLRGLVKDYPEGIGIFKELIQNADDAGAKRIKFIFDWRSHAANKELNHPKLKSLLGPALLVFNDAKFTEADFAGLIKVGEGSKQDSLRKTGRFGLGFNCVYNVTDHPSLISGENICFLDPHGSVVPHTDTTSKGQKWELSEFSAAEPHFMPAFEAGGIEAGDTNFKGSLFRLPFRTSEKAANSQICTSPFTRRTNAEQLLEKLADFGEELLLFLKSVEQIEVKEIEADGTEKTRLLVKTYNPEVVSTERRIFLSILDNQTPNAFISLCRHSPEKLPNTSYLHQIQTFTPQQGVSNSTWRVVHSMAVDANGEIVDVMATMNDAKEKAVPWAGVAARVSSDRSVPVLGKQYCFLPLPETTGLPIHIHGYFDLNSSRQGSTGTDNTGNAAVRSRWNSLLVEHIVVPAIAKLLQELVADVGEKDALAFYGLWPIMAAKLELFRNIPAQLIEAIQDIPVIRSNVDGRWVKPKLVNKLSPEAEALGLFEPLTADKVCLAEPTLPERLIESLQRAGFPLKAITPERVRKHLKIQKEGWGVPVEEAPRPSLRKLHWIEALLKYCLSDNHADLEGLPLALLADGNVYQFGGLELDCVYLASALQRKIFKHCPQWFLDERIQKAVPELTKSQIEGVSMLSPEIVVERLQSLTCWKEDLPQSWEPLGEALPNAPWLSLIYQYFSEVESLPLELSKLPIVPGCDGNLHPGGETGTPLWPSTQPTEQLKQALAYFDVSLISTDEIHRSIFEAFFKQHPFPNAFGNEGNGFIWPLTGSDLIDTLYADRESPPAYQAEHYAAMLTFLCDESLKLSYTLSEEAKKKLSKLPIFPTTCGGAAAPADTNVYLPKAELPDIPLNLKFLKGKEKWQRLIQFTCINKLSLERLIIECILPEYEHWETDIQLKALEWLRIYLPQATEEIRRTGRDYKRLVEKIRATPLIHCTDGLIRPIQETYYPESKLVTDILGTEAPSPDMSGTYTDEPGLWLLFFESLDILHKPRAQDVVSQTERLRDQCAQAGIASVTAACMRLLYYIDETWEELSTEEVWVGEAAVSFPTALKDRAWLPIELDEKVLRKYPGALEFKMKNRLYRADEVLFVQEANLAASQRPILRVKRSPRAEVTEALGFKRATLKEVFDHFDYLIELWIDFKGKALNHGDFQDAVNRVYSYLHDQLIAGKKVNEKGRAELKRRYSERPCLWDNKGNFWKPQHVFEHRVPYFGKRRCGVEKGKFEGLYRLLGQRQHVSFRDYTDFLAEVHNEYGDRPIADEGEVNCVIEVLNRMAHRIEVAPDRGFQPNFLLTEDAYLLPPKEVMIPDANWHLAAVREYQVANLLHPEVDRCIADAANCPSLLRNTNERPSKDSLRICLLPAAKKKAKIWQSNLRSPLFHQGLERLILDSELNASLVNWQLFTKIKVTVADEIYKDLYWGNLRIATRVNGDTYFDQDMGTAYIRYDEQVGIDYLADCLNKQLARTNCVLPDKSKLIRIINAEPEDISELLDSLRVRPIKNSVRPVSDEMIIDEPEPLPKDSTSITKDKLEKLSSNGGGKILAPIEEGNPVETPKIDKPSNIVVIRRPKPELSPNTKPGQGSKPGGGKRNPTKGKPGGRNDRWKTVVYTTHDQHFDSDCENLTQTVRAKIEAAGIRRVLQYEKARSRKPKEKFNNNPGYDISSANIDGSLRYIEVKSFRWAWSGSGAKLSRAQFEMAQTEGDNFWLYVVEKAEDDKAFKIYCIQNPANRVKDFYFDDGWKKISAAENELADLLML